MPLRDVSQTSAPRGLVVPECANCHQSDRVREVKLDGVAPGVQFWRCEGCGFVWAHATTKTCQRRVPHKAIMPAPPPGGIALERLLMLGSVMLIAIGVVTASFW